jgi:CRISPR type III-B/RAMP module RAMP protein Cmr6
MKKLPFVGDKDQKIAERKKIVEWATSCQFGANDGQNAIYGRAAARRQKAMQAFCATYPYCAYSIQFEAVSNCIVGLSSFSNIVIGNAVSLHPTYGFLAIPATSVRGCIRAAREELSAGGQYDDEEYRNSSKEIWGCDADASASSIPSKVVFFDSMISGGAEMDIINQHNKGYYQGTGGSVPDGTDAPNPGSFVSIGKSTCFDLHFAISAKINSELRKAIFRDIVYAFEEMGLGAKTSSGYGFFKAIPQAYEENGQAQAAEVIRIFPDGHIRGRTIDAVGRW